jgi:hypothetical protein
MNVFGEARKFEMVVWASVELFAPIIPYIWFPIISMNLFPPSANSDGIVSVKS